MNGDESEARATRKDLHLGRRLVHMGNGIGIATAYLLFFTHEQVVRTFGTIACLVYILDRIRIHYPEAMKQLPSLNRWLFRAEEQVRESAMVPYAIAILLTLITFPKPAALIAIYTLAIADPLSAIVGIRFGKIRVVPEKSVEGSTAFFAAAFVCAASVLWAFAGGEARVLGAAALIALCGAVFEMLPVRIDDNLTTPLVVGFTAWITAALFGLPL